MLSRILAASIAAALLMSTPAHAEVVLKANSWLPRNHPLVAKVLVPFCADIEKVTEQRVKCVLLPKAVASPAQTFDAVRDGLADLSFISPVFNTGRFPIASVVEFPFIADSAEVASVAYQRVYDRMLKQFDEYKGVVTLAVYTLSPGHIFNAKRQINSVDDLRDLKIRVGGGYIADITRALGAVSIQKPVTEAYELISMGVADGVFLTKEAMSTFKLAPLIKYATFVPGGLYNANQAMIVNPAAWNKISEKDQAAIIALSGEALARRAGRAFDEADVIGIEAMRSAGVQTQTASPQLVEQIRERVTPIEQTWSGTIKGQGADGAAILKALRDEAAKVAREK